MTEEMQQGPGRGQGFVEGIHTVEKISFADICEISSRKCLQRPVGIEIFTEGGEGMLFTVIYLANAGQIEDPDMIFPGQIFRLPAPPGE